MSEIIRTRIENISGNELMDLELAKRCCEILGRHYPAHMWEVVVDSAGGIITIKNMMLSGQWGYTVHLKGFVTASELDKKIMRAGGEVLERFKMHRGRFTEDDYAILPKKIRHEVSL